MTQNVRLQNLRDFTVQIRNADNKTVGTGIAVSADGKIVTCAHVVQSALGTHPRDVNGAEVGIYFPQVGGIEEKKYNAKVNCCFPEHDDDMVLLQIIGEKSPLAPEQIAVLGMADQSEGNPFRIYGYSPIGNYPATRGDGIIQGSVEAPVDRKLQVDPIQLKSRDIAAGMSGAAVLDVTRNLIVGLVMERFYSDHSVQDDIGYGVDSKVLTFDPFDFVLRGEALELKPAPELRLDKDLFQQAIEIVNYVRAHRKPADRFSWNSAPTVLPEWTGRDDLLAQIAEDWNNPKKHVTGLIGFGGEGKSSLARKWVETIIGSKVEGQKSPDLQPSTFDGVFWWGFYENRSIDEFLESALNFMSGGRIDPRQVPSSSLRAQIIGAMLGAGRYLFVLDGLEVSQHQEGDQYGLLTSNDLRDLLTYFARPDNESFCLITSRAPVLDLMDYTTYTHRDVERLSEADGVVLLKRLQVKGSKGQMGKVVSDWDGHALTISLLGSYLAEKYDGDIAHLADIPIPTADEPRYQRVHRVLRRYDEHLAAAEREFLKLFSAFRNPVSELAFEKVFVPLLFPATENTENTEKKKKGFFSRIFNSVSQSSILPITASRISNIVSRLTAYRIIKHDALTQTYTTHPLIRNHYFTYLTRDTGIYNAHLKIKDYYLSIAGDQDKDYPTLEDLSTLIEVVHHACQAGAYDDAHSVLWNRIYKTNSRIIIHRLGAYETNLNVLLEFFPNRDATKEPQTNDQSKNHFILNEIGLCLMSLGRLHEAVPFFRRYIEGTVGAQDQHNASDGCQSLASLYAYLGLIEESVDSASQAVDFALKAENKQDEFSSLAIRAWSLYLKGNLPGAYFAFKQAEKTINQLKQPYLVSLWGIQHADYLRKTKALYYAKRVAVYNLDQCLRGRWTFLISQCYRVLGDLSVEFYDYKTASQHYEAAVKVARSSSHRQTLIEALLARGKLFSKKPEQSMRFRFFNLLEKINKKVLRKTQNDFVKVFDLEQAFIDLYEALAYAVEGGYRIYEADIRVALAWAYLANGEKEKAKQSAQRALQMSQEMGYHWGMVDAEEVLGMMKAEG